MDTQNPIYRMNIISVFKVKLSLICVLFLHIIFPSSASEVVSISSVEDGQLFPQGVSDGKGGFIIVWEDYRTSKNWDIYAQRIDKTNNLIWQQNGLPISVADRNQRRLRMIGHDTHVIVVWNDRRGRSSWDIYAQAVNIHGEIMWEKDGIPICTNTADQSTQAILSDGEGGAIFVWEDERNSSEFQDLYIQRVNSAGETLWKHDGIPVHLSETLQSNPILIAGGETGFYVVWWDVVGHNEWHIMAHKLNFEGVNLWDEPLLVSPSDGTQGDHRVVSDQNGGLIVVWQIYENFINDQLYAQRISPEGNKMWNDEGVPICTADGIQKNATIVSDRNGGAIVVWRDERDIYSDIYAQRINADGTLIWEKDGIPICTVGGHQDRPFIVTNEENRFFIAWLDYRGDFGEKSVDALYCQQIDLDGNLMWNEDGTAISTHDGEHFPPYVISDGKENLCVIWSNSQRDSGDIFLRRF